MMIQNIDIMSYMTFLINEVACTMEYDWSNDFKHEDLSKHYQVVQEKMKQINFNKLTEEEMLILGFRKFKSEDEGFLVPLWLFKVLPEGTRLKSIADEEVVVGQDKLDNDTRGGSTAYMLIQEKE